MNQLNNFVNPNPQAPVVCEEEIADEGHNRRGAFAAMKDLSEPFATAGLHTEQVWAYLKSEHGVETRSQLTDLQWASIACRLQAMRRNGILLETFIDGIPDKHFRFYVLATDPTVPVGRPRVDLSKYHLPEVWGDFQSLANDLQTELEVRQGKSTMYYSPTENRASAREGFRADGNGSAHRQRNERRGSEPVATSGDPRVTVSSTDEGMDETLAPSQNPRFSDVPVLEPEPAAPVGEVEREVSRQPVGCRELPSTLNSVSNLSEIPNSRGEILNAWGDVVEVIS